MSTASSRATPLVRSFWLALAFALTVPLFVTSEEIGRESPFPGPYLDKIVHASYFGMIAFALDHGLARRSVWPAIFVAIAIGGADELHQRSVAGREADWLDWGADMAGASVAGILGWRRRRMRAMSAGPSG